MVEFVICSYMPKHAKNTVKGDIRTFLNKRFFMLESINDKCFVDNLLSIFYNFGFIL